MLFARMILKLLLTVLLALLIVLGWSKRDAVYDWWRLRGYDPPKTVVELAKHGTMTDKARHLFYINRPALIADKTKFQKACTKTEQTIVLGCYQSPQLGISIFDVRDKRLAGVEEVTAAHEMLHAAYDRLSSDERQQIDGWLNDFYKNDLKDQRIKKNIASYKKTEPKDIVNEMHSIFGTEVRQLPSNLEKYYQRYFGNRLKVVAYSEKYEAEFTAREQQAKEILTQLKSLEAQISQSQANLAAVRQQLEADRGSIDSQAEADAFNARVNAYNAEVANLNSLVDQYNSLRLQYNQLVLQQRQLLKAIDTRSKIDKQ
ncbi:hypothetical protein HY380_00240 [Candidatus Saccharibacteria bacterium]|nr:hypothetical protein [Candidatus Saccharibacteria bacterium]